MTRARDVANLIGSGNYSSTTFTATAGQTAFTISHTQGFIQVFMNGLLLDETVDWTSDGSAVTLTSGAAAGDEIEVVAYNTFSVGDAITQTAADTRYVNTTGDSMTGALSVSGGANSAHLTLSGTANRGLKISTSNPDGQNDGTVILNAQDTEASGAYAKMSFQTAGTERMKIDSAGRVTTPYQPAFDAGLTSGSVAATNTVVFNNVTINQGSHYNSSNGRFTAPISGIYEFYWGGIKNALSAVTRAVLYKNGVGIRENRLAEGINYTNACWIMLISLNSSDYVEIKVTAGDFYGSTDFYGNAFGGRLVG